MMVSTATSCRPHVGYKRPHRSTSLWPEVELEALVLPAPTHPSTYGSALPLPLRPYLPSLPSSALAGARHPAAAFGGRNLVARGLQVNLQPRHLRSSRLQSWMLDHRRVGRKGSWATEDGAT